MVKRPTIRDIIEEFNAKRRDVKPGTRNNWKQGHESFAAFVGEDRRIDSITLADAEDWRQQLIDRRLQESTIRTHAKNCKTLFGFAVRWEYIVRNRLGR